MPLPRPTAAMVRPVAVLIYLVFWCAVTWTMVQHHSPLIGEMWWPTGPGGAVILWRGLSSTPPQPPAAGGGGE